MIQTILIKTLAEYYLYCFFPWLPMERKLYFIDSLLFLSPWKRQFLNKNKHFFIQIVPWVVYENNIWKIYLTYLWAKHAFSTVNCLALRYVYVSLPLHVNTLYNIAFYLSFFVHLLDILWKYSVKKHFYGYDFSYYLTFKKWLDKSHTLKR